MNTNANPLNSEELHALAKKRVDMKIGFLTHLLVFCCVNGGFMLLGVLRGREWEFHAPFPIWGWALGLLIHGVVTWASLQGMDLRGRLMAQELEQLRRQQG